MRLPDHGMQEPVFRDILLPHLQADEFTGQVDTSDIKPVPFVNDHHVSRGDLQVIGTVTKILAGTVFITHLNDMRT